MKAPLARFAYVIIFLVVVTYAFFAYPKGMHAWQDKQRVIVVGERSLGDCFMNGRVPLPEGRGELLFRTGLLERAGPAAPGGGVKPDHQVALTKEQEHALRIWFNKQEQPFNAVNLKEAGPKDPQLARAVEVLKAALTKSG